MKDWPLYLMVAFVLFMLGGGWYLSWKENQVAQSFAAREQQLKAQMDSVVQLQREADLFAIQMATKYNVAKVQLAEQSKVTEKFKLRYEAIKNVSPKKYTDKEIDSVLTILYPIR